MMHADAYRRSPAIRKSRQLETTIFLGILGSLSLSQKHFRTEHYE
jgi:hypothetical protein